MHSFPHADTKSTLSKRAAPSRPLGALGLAVLGFLVCASILSADSGRCAMSHSAQLAGSTPLVDHVVDGVPADAVLVSITYDKGGLLKMTYRPSGSHYDLSPIGAIDGEDSVADELDCDPFSPIHCGRCLYSGNYVTTYAPCGSCGLTSCGRGQAGETKLHDCWICNPRSWNWCNPPQTVGYTCIQGVCC